MRKIQYIVLHHSATDYQANDKDTDGAVIAKTICERQSGAWIKEYPDYKCDYHFIIGHTGKVFNGQPVEQAGWHCTNYQANLASIGICFLGNFENIEMPIEQFTTGVKLVKDLMKQYSVPLASVLRHKDIVSDITHRANSTVCPGKNFPYVPMLDSLRNGEPFFDIGEDYPYIKEVKTLKTLGVVKGDGKGYLKPHDYITREEAILIVYRLYKTLAN
jgi:N-acetyl-anhydromuramyl-L-alanine amidase AmpD